MKRISMRWSLLLSLCAVTTQVLAADVPSSADSLEPGVNTSAAQAAPAPKAPAAPAAIAKKAPSPAATAPAAPAGAAARGPAVSNARGGARATDRVELDNTQITGNRELPRVMYVVPWKRPDLGDFGGRPAKSLLDELLQPVDRDVFKRQVRYYDALQPDAAGGATASGAAAATGSTENTGAATTGTRDEK
jgi:hypothetical protein